LAEPFDVAGQRVHVQASVGIAIAPPHTAPDLLRFAEAAMNDAKAHGQGRIQVFEPALVENAAEWLVLSNDLRDALADDQLRLHYQPVVDLTDGRIIGVEALARWTHPLRGPVPPARFVAIAEATGLATALDRWVLTRVCRDAAELRHAMPHQMHVAVNISAPHLTDPDLEAAVLATLHTGQLAAGELMLEITEGAMVVNLDQAQQVLRRLRARGVKAAIDDFGTGYSSLSYLSRLPVDTVKIDRSFVQAITDEPDALAITSSIIALAQDLRLTTVAEGIETVQQLAHMQKLGCTAAQGYLFSPALPPHRVVELLDTLPHRRFEMASTADPAGKS
jgi:EAL domain-containing protein (putative c-di-GMP-specific phosphodiesterase class I)